MLKWWTDSSLADSTNALPVDQGRNVQNHETIRTTIKHFDAPLVHRTAILQVHAKRPCLLRRLRRLQEDARRLRQSIPTSMGNVHHWIHNLALHRTCIRFSMQS